MGRPADCGATHLTASTNRPHGTPQFATPLVINYGDEQNTTRRFGGPDHFSLLVQTFASSVDPSNTFCIC
jgi:hypothetical protein